MRILSMGLLLLAACGGGKPPGEAQAHPEEVAKATFEALKAGALAPLEAHLMTAEESKALTGAVLDDSDQRQQWETLFAQYHERLNVDWESAAPGTPRVKYQPMGGGAIVTLPIKSARGTVAVEIEVVKVRRRFVFQGVTPMPGSELKQAAPEGDDGAPAEDGG